MAKHNTSSFNGNISTPGSRGREARAMAAIKHEHEREALIQSRAQPGKKIYDAEVRLIEAGELEAPYKRMTARAAVEQRNRNRDY